MREIKFRFWDTIDNEWMIDGRCQTNILDFAFLPAMDWSYITRDEVETRVIVEQFTGLKDKNETDLDWWENDVLEFIATTGGCEAAKYRGVIKHCRGSFVIMTKCPYWSSILLYNLDGNNEYHTHYQKNKWTRFDYKGWGFTKIGNIHENPELLNAT